MKKLAFLAVLILGGCTTTDGTNLKANLKAIQDQIRFGCSFVPTIQTIAAIVTANGGSTFGVVEEVCLALTSAPLADGGRRVVVVRGVPVRGRRI